MWGSIVWLRESLKKMRFLIFIIMGPDWLSDLRLDNETERYELCKRFLIAMKRSIW